MKNFFIHTQIKIELNITLIHFYYTNNMFELPDELWGLIKEFTLDWKHSHKQKMKSTLTSLDGLYEEVYKRWTYFPPWPNTNDIITAEYAARAWRMDWAPRPNLKLSSITWNPKGTGGWWCGYGWGRKSI